MLLQFVLIGFVFTTSGVKIMIKDSKENVVEGNSKYPKCSVVSDLKKYANCHSLKANGQCEPHRGKMKFYCPITCKFCRGKIISEWKQPAPPGAASQEAACKSSKYGCCKDGITESKGNNGLACPENCRDVKNYACSFYENINFCSIYYKQMLTKCPFTCGFCKPEQKKKEEHVDTCVDVWKTSMCKRFVHFRMCDAERFGKQLTAKCKKSCRKCIKDAPELSEIAEPCARTSSCCWDKSEPKNGKCPECRNMYREKFCKRFQPDCSKHSVIKSVQIRQLCTKTCGMCKANECRDDLVYGNFCMQWKLRGECQNSADMMKTYCRKTCDFC